MLRLSVRWQLGGWWIIGDDEPYGPYTTRKEANEDRRGLMRTEQHKHKRGFFTTDPPKKRPRQP